MGELRSLLKGDWGVLLLEGPGMTTTSLTSTSMGSSLGLLTKREPLRALGSFCAAEAWAWACGGAEGGAVEADEGLRGLGTRSGLGLGGGWGILSGLRAEGKACEGVLVGSLRMLVTPRWAMTSRRVAMGEPCTLHSVMPSWRRCERAWLERLWLRMNSSPQNSHTMSRDESPSRHNSSAHTHTGTRLGQNLTATMINNNNNNNITSYNIHWGKFLPQEKT